MSKGKNILILSGVMVVLFGSYFYLNWRNAQKAAQSETNPEPAKTLISQMAQEKMISLQLKSAVGTLSFQKKNGAWISEALPYPLDQDRINLVAESLARLEAVAVIDSNPKDLAQYGLDQPAVTAEAGLNDQTTGTLYLGETTPAGNNYYAMVKGDPKVYAIAGPDGSRFSITANDLRDKDLSSINLQQCNYFKLTRLGGKPVEITVNPDHAPAKEDYGMSYWQLAQPYAEPLSVNIDKFNKEVLAGLENLAINEYIEDRPADLGKYGLDQPRYELLVRDTQNQTLHLLFGKDQNSDYVYCKQPDIPAVFTLSKDIMNVLALTPFQLVNKIAYLMNIDNVDKIVVATGGKQHTLTLSRKIKKAPSKKEPDETITTYRIDGKPVAEAVFKTFYRAIIGIAFEAENPKAVAETNPEVQTTFYLNSGKVRQYRINYVPFNPDFYAIYRNGRSEFLTSKEQVKAMLSDLEAMAQGKLKERNL